MTGFKIRQKSAPNRRSYLYSFFVVDPPDHFDAGIGELGQVGVLVTKVPQDPDDSFPHTHPRVLQRTSAELEDVRTSARSQRVRSVAVRKLRNNDGTFCDATMAERLQLSRVVVNAARVSPKSDTRPGPQPRGGELPIRPRDFPKGWLLGTTSDNHFAFSSLPQKIVQQQVKIISSPPQ